MEKSNAIGWPTATALVIANMIGAGIFTSLGFQLENTENTWSIVLLWTSGALMALCGAFSYAELGTRFPRSGGEYRFLTEAFHPILGYLSGWVSLTIGFAAPVALSAMALGEYIGPYLNIKGLKLALSCVLVISLLHSISLKKSSWLQNTTTFLKVLLIVIFIYFGITTESSSSAFVFGEGWKSEVVLPAFAVSFVFVTFSYSGWNAAAYIVEEIRAPRRNLPIALITGTLVVSLLYLSLNFVFLKHNSLGDLKGTLEIGRVTAIAIFGESGGKLISFGIGFLLISSISAMVWAGPRVTQAMGEDHRLWKWFSFKTRRRIPVRALWLQTAITTGLMLSGTFEQVMVYSGFVLQMFSALAVAAVIAARRKSEASGIFKSPLYPMPQLLYVVLSLWIMIYLAIAQPIETGLGMLNLLLGITLYYLGGKLRK